LESGVEVGQVSWSVGRECIFEFAATADKVCSSLVDAGDGDRQLTGESIDDLATCSTIGRNTGGRTTMALNRKQKKQLEVIHKKLQSLQQQLAGEKQQMDDPAAIKRIEDELQKLAEQRRAIEAEK
jgi:hypothetical protein